MPAQANLRSIAIAGDPRYVVDPYQDDLVRRLVEVRARVRAEQREAARVSDTDLAHRLDAIQLGTKVAANSGAYGTAIEINVVESGTPLPIDVYRPDGSQFRCQLNRSEEPGTWFHPLLATLVAAGGRLLLAAAMRLLADAGGIYAFSDTDSLFCGATETGGGLLADGAAGDRRALTWDEVRALVDRFESLNPFDSAVVPGSILKLEPENFDPETGAQRQVWCLSLASKRYTLYDLRDGRPAIVRTADKSKRSEHGLGHLLAPDGGSDRGWIDEWWEYLIGRELGTEATEPAWFGQPALGRVSVTSPAQEAMFRRFNEGRPYQRRVRPWNFLLQAHAHPLERATSLRSLIAPFTRDPRRLRGTRWFDRANPQAGPYRIRSGDPEFAIPGAVAVQTYGDYFGEFRSHPEAKSAGPDGQPCQPWTRGLLQPLQVRVTKLRRIGKEANRLSEEPELHGDDEDRPIEYVESACGNCGRPVDFRRRWCSEACRKRGERRAAFVAKCDACGKTLTFGHRRWCSDRCRKRAGRRRTPLL